MSSTSYYTIFMTALKWVATLAMGSTAVVAGGLYFFQNDIIYASSMPLGSRTQVDSPEKHGLPEYEDVTLQTPDGERLHCYLILQTRSTAASRPTIVLYHANAGNMGHRLPIARVFHQQMGLNVFMLSYRGYGKSTGKANEKGMKIDAQTALNYVLDHSILKDTKLFAYGQSIGGAVAIDIVARNQSRFAGLIIENTFLSIRALIPNVMPIATPISRFCHQLWSSEDLIDSIEIPTLFLSGLKDELVPKRQMAELYSRCNSTNKIWREFTNGTHNDTVAQPGYMKNVFEFIKEVAQIPTDAMNR